MLTGGEEISGSNRFMGSIVDDVYQSGSEKTMSPQVSSMKLRKGVVCRGEFIRLAFSTPPGFGRINSPLPGLGTKFTQEVPSSV